MIMANNIIIVLLGTEKNNFRDNDQKFKLGTKS